MRSFKHIALILLAIVLVASPGYAQKKKKGKKDKQENTNGIDHFTVQKVFMEANKAKILEDYPEAVRLFEKVIKLDNKNDASYYELATIYFQSNQFDIAMSNINTAVKLQPQNKWYLDLKAEILAYRSKFAEAAEVYAEMLKYHPRDYDRYFDHAFMLIKASKYEEAIAVYDEYESIIGLDENVIVQKQRLYIKLGDIENATAEIQKLIDNDPKEVRNYHLLAELYLTNDMLDEMEAVYEKLLKEDPDNAQALLNIAEMHRKKGNQEKALTYLKQAFGNADLAIEQKIRILFPYLQNQQQDEAKKKEGFELAEILVSVHDKDARSHAIYGDMLYRDEQTEEALVEYDKAIAIDNSIYEVWQQVFFIHSDKRNYDALYQRTSEALELFPNQPLVYFFNGVSADQLKKHQEAVDALEMGKDLVVGNILLKAQFFSSLGGSYNDLKLYSKSDSAFDTALLYDPDNAFTLNNYSYYLSLRKDRLEKAKKMSARSNELEPNNASFQDTYAWILYQNEDYKNAKVWMEKAINSSEDENATLFEHYGDILFKLGDIEGALVQWQKAEAAGSDSELIGKKIADKQLYE